MNIKKLAIEYKNQAELLSKKIEALRPLLYIYSGDDLTMLRRRVKIYYDLSVECERISKLLLETCEE